MMKRQTLTKSNITLKTLEKDRERMLLYSTEKQLHLLGMVLSRIQQCYRFQADFVNSNQIKWFSIMIPSKFDVIEFQFQV